MPAGLSRRRGAILYLLAWLLLGLIFAAMIVAAAGAGWSQAIWFAVPVTVLYGVGSGFSAYYLCRAYPLTERRTSAIVAVFLLAAIVAGLLLAGLAMGWNAVLADDGGIVFAPPLRAMVFALGTILYCLSAVGHYLAIEFERARAAERRELEAALAAREADLRMLRTQIDPHFLFNSLNSISALTSIDAARARAMTLQLADFFRLTLRLDARQDVTLAAEADLARRFLAIEQVRFGARLQTVIEIGTEAAACLVPPMILQPLVENAVKHGLGQLSEGGLIAIRAQRIGSRLHIAVENAIDGDIGPVDTSGIGLINVRQRLAVAHGHEASVHWSRTDLRFRVELALPAQTMEPECE